MDYELEEAKKELRQGVDRILSGRVVEDGFITGYIEDKSTNTRHYFECLTSGGIKLEAQMPYIDRSKYEAVQGYLNMLTAYLGKHTADACIYWRCKPELEKTNDGYFVYSRIIVAGEGLVGVKNPFTSSIPAYSPGYLQPGWRTFRKGPNDNNKSGFRATGHRILLETEAVEEFSAGGIALVQKTQIAEANRAVVCTVLEIGPDAWADKSTDYCDLGDRVLIGQYVGKFHESPVDGKTYRFVADLDIITPLPAKSPK